MEVRLILRNLKPPPDTHHERSRNIYLKDAPAFQAKDMSENSLIYHPPKVDTPRAFPFTGSPWVSLLLDNDMMTCDLFPVHWFCVDLLPAGLCVINGPLYKLGVVPFVTKPYFLLIR